MADLVERLLNNSSSSQLLAILSSYLETTESKRDGEFYCSLRSVLVALKEHGELSDETALRILREFCIPVLISNTLTDRHILHSIYDLIVLCCAIGPKDLVHEIISNCLDGLSSYYTEESMSPTGLPVVSCLDLVSYLMKEDLRSVVSEDSREKLFHSLLDVLCKSDELICARISSSILPLFHI